MLPVLRSNSVTGTWQPVNRLESLFNRVFGETWPWDGAEVAEVVSSAPMALWHDDENVHVEIELPGVNASDVEILVHNDTLTVQGQRRAEGERKYLYNTRSYGQFTRSIRLPDLVDAGSARAEFRDGVLCLTLPKRPEARPKRISVERAG